MKEIIDNNKNNNENDLNIKLKEEIENLNNSIKDLEEEKKLWHIAIWN